MNTTTTRSPLTIEQLDARIARLQRQNGGGAMAASFPLGCGRGGRPRRSAKSLDRSIDASVRRSGEINRLIARRNALTAPPRPAAPVRPKRVREKPLREEPRLFIGLYPAGIVYADSWVEVHGDYAKLAFLSYERLVLDVEPRCKGALLKEVLEHSASIQARAGEQFVVSGSGQTVLLGCRPMKPRTLEEHFSAVTAAKEITGE